MRWETVVTSEFFGRKIKLLTVSARPSEEGEQRDGAARSLWAVRATLALAEVGFAPPAASSGIPALPGASRRRRGSGERGRGQENGAQVGRWQSGGRWCIVGAWARSQLLTRSRRGAGCGAGSAASRDRGEPVLPFLPSGATAAASNSPGPSGCTARKGRGVRGKPPKNKKGNNPGTQGKQRTDK